LNRFRAERLRSYVHDSDGVGVLGERENGEHSLLVRWEYVLSPIFHWRGEQHRILTRGISKNARNHYHAMQRL